MTAQFLVTLLIVILIIPLYYSVVDSRITALSKPLLLVMWVPRAYSYREGRSLWRLGLASSAQLIFLSCLVVLTGVAVSDAFQAPLRPIHLVYAVLLGIGEMGLSSFLCHVVVKAIMTLAPSWGPNSMQAWITIARGGWMREYLNALDTAPLFLALVLTVLYVGVEELVFRAVLVTFAQPLGLVGSVAFSTVLFALVQTFQLPSLRAAIFPVIGACVMGVAHGALFYSEPNVVPLVIAHCVFFFVAVR